METANLIILIIGVLICILGIGTFFNPNLAKWINLPGSHTIKAIGSTAVGVIMIIISFLVQIPN